VQENLGGKYKIVIPEYAPWITLSQAPEGRAPLADHSVWIKIGENGIDDLAREGRVFVQGTENTDLIDIFVVRQAGGRPPVEDERVTLLAIAEALGGLGTWQDNYKTSWQPENDLENWTSVTVDAATKKHVIKLSLPAPAKGQLPKEIGDLTYLEELVFSTNDVGGKFPPQIANLKQLKSLTLGGNSTSGMKFELVPEFGALTALKTLKVSGGFSGSPGAHVDAIGWLENLESLEMSFGNYGTRMPETWGNLKKLQTLILNEVEFSNIDPVGGMTALRTLWLSDMQKLRSALPESLGNLSELNVLRISNTSLPGLPQSLGNLSKLTELNITGTLITELPASIKDLGELRELTLTNDSLLTALPGSLSGMTRLTSLRITSNKNLAGELPADIGNLAQVSSLNISRNPKLTGKIPESISKLQRLTVLYMDRNAFTGLPASIGEMTNLTGIELQGNDFRDTIPVSIGNLKKLEWLYLYREKKDLSKGLMGPIPESIGEIETLRRIYLQNNQLSGVIPETFSKLNRLLHLYLNDNGLTGNLPGFLAKLPGLTEILLQNNGLSGALPTDFQDATGIQILNLYNNNFEGTIPQGFHGKGQAYTGSTAILDLEMNRLSGTIPEDFLRRAEADSKHFKFRQQKLGFGFTN
jgi:Leucine-rich repeat (LRR) protein